MPVSINNTTLTFNDATTQTTSGVTVVNVGTGLSSTGGKTPTLTNTGVTSVTAGSGISVSASTGGVTISASGGGVTSLNGQTGAITDTGFGVIGSYVLAGILGVQTIITFNSTYASTNFRFIRTNEISIANPYQSSNASYIVNPSLTGTWRAMMNYRNGSDNGYGEYAMYAIMFVRIS
jgi:hypothetical protein